MLKMMTAVSENWVIGGNGKMLWKLRDDMRHFKKETDGQIVVLGRKTCQSLRMQYGDREMLPGRNKIVLTRDKSFVDRDCRSYHKVDVDAFVRLSKATSKDVIIIGGAEIYKLYLQYIDQLILTSVSATVEGDTFFPKNWAELAGFEPDQPYRADYFPKNEFNEYPFVIYRYKR